MPPKRHQRFLNVLQPADDIQVIPISPRTPEKYKTSSVLYLTLEPFQCNSNKPICLVRHEQRNVQNIIV
jgi:hypothetical protein